MKKHILGAALFSLIVASFAVIFAFFYSPSIPPKEAVKPPVPRTEPRAEKPYACAPKRSNQISYEVRNAELDIAKNKFVSSIEISWDGKGAPPEKLIVKPQLFTLENIEKSVDESTTLRTATLIEPFKKGNKLTLLIKSDLPQDDFVSGDENIYVIFNIQDAESGYYLTKTNKRLPEAHQVLLIHNGKPAVFVKEPKFKLQK